MRKTKIRVYDGDFGLVKPKRRGKSKLTEKLFVKLLNLIWSNPLKTKVIRRGKQRTTVLCPVVTGTEAKPRKAMRA